MAASKKAQAGGKGAQAKGKGGKGAPAKGGAGRGGQAKRAPWEAAAPTGRRARQVGGEGAQAATVTASATAPAEQAPPPRLKERYTAEVAPAMRQEFRYANPMQVPTLTKIVVNMGVGEAARDAKLIEGAVRDLTLITGQKPAVARARKSIAQFKLREGMPIGVHATLRGNRMWEFCDRLLTLALPRIRDFRGLGDTFDGSGNYTFGLTEQLMFHEINPDQVDRQRGMHVTVVTTAKTDAEGRSLLRRLGFPFKES
jgi:large subunit ribosomal protein L5